MKKTGLILLLCTVGVFAQDDMSPATTPAAPTTQSAAAVPADQPPIVETNANFPRVQIATPTYADLYCAGFINKEALPDANYVGGGLNTPSTTKYVNGDIVYLHGHGYQPGAQYTVIRELHDINEFEAFPGQHELLKQAGHPYEEVGRVKVLDNRNKVAVAQVEYSCDSILPGDNLIPFVEKTTVAFHPPVKFDRFAPPAGKLSGRIVMAKDFDVILGTGMKVYMNVGSNQGLKVGDYLRAVRSYSMDAKNPVDSVSFDAPVGEDNQKKRPRYERGIMGGWGKSGPVINEAEFPRRAVGEVVVIGVTPTTSTGMITFALEDVHTGDAIEVINEQ
jgi:hypothetical protein